MDKQREKFVAELNRLKEAVRKLSKLAPKTAIILKEGRIRKSK